MPFPQTVHAFKHDDALEIENHNQRVGVINGD